MATDGEEIGLASFLHQVRVEFDLAQERLNVSGQTPMLDWESAELEISFGIKRDVTAKTGVKLYVFSAELGGRVQSEESHRLKLKLKPSAGSIVAVAGDAE